jgi:hypothetical protein
MEIIILLAFLKSIAGHQKMGAISTVIEKYIFQRMHQF